MKRKVYSIFEDERTFIFEEQLNEQGNTCHYKFHQSDDQAEVSYEYDDKGLLICEREFEDGFETTRTEITYNEQDLVLTKQVYISDDLFEEVSYEYFEGGHSMRKTRMGEEIERYLERSTAETFYSEHHDENGLFEKHNGKYVQDENLEIIELEDAEGNLLGTKRHWYDDDEKILKFELKNANGNLMNRTVYAYEGKLEKRIKYEDYFYNDIHEVTFEYDERNNRVSIEKRAPKGKLLEYHKLIYDEQNRVISENGFSIGNFNAIYGSYLNNEKFHFEHEYLDE